MRIYKVDEANWYCGNTPEEAVAAYLSDIGPEGEEYVKDFGAAIEISDEEMDSLKIVEVDAPGHPEYTFREALAEMTKPGFIATNEY